MELYSFPYRLRSRDVNKFRHLRPSQIFELLQEAATDHSDILHVGINEIRRQNLMWVLARQSVEILRMPVYGEEITVETWPGKTIHSLYPRYYRLLDAEGQTLVNSAAIWMLADMDERVLVPSARSGIEFGFEKRGIELSLPSPPRSFYTDCSTTFTVPFSYIDMNGHMNNTRYFDLVDNLSPAAAEGKDPSKILVEYSAELLQDQEYEILYGVSDNRFYLRTGGDKPLFRIMMEY